MAKVRKRENGSRGFGGGFPLIEEGQNVLGGHGAGGRELVLLLTVEESAVGVENSDGRDAVFDGDLVFLGEVQILIHAADINVRDKERFVERRGDLGTMEGGVENVAVEAPLAAKDEQNAFVRRGGLAENGSDL